MFLLRFFVAACLGSFFSLVALADRVSLEKDADLPQECFDRKLVGAAENANEVELEEKLVAFFKRRKEDEACQKELRPALANYYLKRNALLKTIKENLNEGTPGDPNSRRPKDAAAYKAIQKAESVYLGTKIKLFMGTLANPTPLFDRCGFCATRMVHRQEVKDKSGTPMARYVADGSCLVFDEVIELPIVGSVPLTAEDRYENSWQDLTNLSTYPRNPLTLTGYDHVFAFHRVTKNGELMVKPDEKDQEAIRRINDLKENQDSYLFITAGIHYGFSVLFYYFTENHLYPKAQRGDYEEFWLRYATTDLPELQNADPAITQYRLNAEDPPKGVKVGLLKNSKGGWCISKKAGKKLPDGKKKSGFFYSRYSTLGDFPTNNDLVERLARTTLLETLFENVRNSFRILRGARR